MKWAMYLLSGVRVITGIVKRRFHQKCFGTICNSCHLSEEQLMFPGLPVCSRTASENKKTGMQYQLNKPFIWIIQIIWFIRLNMEK
jgi:hypothetical protein